MSSYRQVLLGHGVEGLAAELAPVFAAKSTDSDRLEVLRLASELDQEDDMEVEKILHSCFPVFEKVITVVHDPLRQIFHWLRSLSPKDIVMQTDMTGAFTVVFGRKKQRPLEGSKHSSRAAWLRERFKMLWPAVVPNGGRPFLVVVRGTLYYVLEPN